MKLTPFVVTVALLVSGVAWAAGTIAARHGMTGEQYQAEFDSIVGQGYRPVEIDVYAVPQGIRYAAIWRQSSSTRPWIARHGLSQKQFQNEFNSAVAQGYRLQDVSVAFGGVYAGIWEQGEGPAWEARAGLDQAAFGKKFDEMAAAGFRLTDVEGYQDEGGTRYAAIWQKNDGRGWYAWINMTSEGYQAKFDEMRLKGYWPVHVDGYMTAGGVRFAAIFEGKSKVAAARHNLTNAQYQQAFNDMAAQGLTLKEVSGYSDGQQALYAALWEK